MATTKTTTQAKPDHADNQSDNYSLDEALAASSREVTPVEALRAVEIDKHMATARQFKRSVKGFRDSLTELVTLDADTAAECCYSLQRGGKRVTGPSIRFAESVVLAWGNLAVNTTVVRDDTTAAIVLGRAYDSQVNVEVAVETRRAVYKKKSKAAADADDTALAVAVATSLAYRNVVLRIVPRALWYPIYLAACDASTGKGTMEERRNMAFDAYKKLGATEAQVLAALGRKGREDVSVEDLQHLRGMYSAIRDKTLTLEDALQPPDVERPRGPASVGKSSLAAKLETAREPAPAQTAAPEPHGDGLDEMIDDMQVQPGDDEP